MSKRETKVNVIARPVPGSRLVIEEVLDDSLAFIHLDDVITATIMGYQASVSLMPGLALVITAMVDRPPLSSVSVSIRNSCGSASRIMSIGEISVSALSSVREVEFRYFVAPMCYVRE